MREVLKLSLGLLSKDATMLGFQSLLLLLPLAVSKGPNVKGSDSLSTGAHPLTWDTNGKASAGQCGGLFIARG